MKKNQCIDENNEKLIFLKLLQILELLEKICEKRNEVTRLRNHPIHEYTYFLKNYTALRIYKIEEIKLLSFEATDLLIDLKNSRNLFIKNGVKNVLSLFEELLNDNSEQNNEQILDE